MSEEKELSDIHWLVLDLLMRAKELGVHVLSKTEILYNEAVPIRLRMQLGFHCMTVPKEYVSWQGNQLFSITPAGEALHRAKFKKPSTVPDHIIALPDNSHTTQ